MIAHRGYESASMTDLATDLDLSKATIYHYFKSKEEIFEEIIVDTLTELFDYVRDGIDSTAPAPEQLRKFMSLHATFFETNFWSFTAMLYGFGGIQRSKRKDEVIKLRDNYENLLRSIIRGGIKSGEFRNLDVAITSRAVLSLLNWMVRWYNIGGPVRAHEIALQYSDLILNGLIAHGAAGQTTTSKAKTAHRR